MDWWLFFGVWMFGVAVSPYARDRSERDATLVSVIVMLPIASALIAARLS